VNGRPSSCACEPSARAGCGRCPPSAPTRAQLRLSAPVTIPLDEDRRRAAIAALAALLAPYLNAYNPNGRRARWGRRPTRDKPQSRHAPAPPAPTHEREEPSCPDEP
jgi:hypothetical protein